MSKELSDLISRNTYLRFIDADSDAEYKYEDIYDSRFENDSVKRLAFLYLDNSISSAAVLLSFLNSDHCTALLSTQLHPDFKFDLEKLYNPDYIVDNSRPALAGYEHASAKTFSYFTNIVQPDKPIRSEVKLLLSTSGTTGSPKFVKLSGQNIVQNALSIIDYLPINKEDVTPISLPLYYSYGFSIFTTNCISGGKIVCSVKDYMNKLYWEELDKYQFTSISGVPYVYEMLNRLGFTKTKHLSVRYMTQAGGKMNEQLLAKFAEYARNENIRFYVMYGQTEATARMSYLNPENLESKLGSIGKPILKGKFDIDPETSELNYSGPNVFGGYAENRADLDDFIQSEWLHTGDVAKQDDEGYFYITGRIKRMVKIFGNRVNLDETEQILKNHFSGYGFACTGISDKFLLITATAPDTKKSDIISFIQDHLDIHPSAIKIAFVEEIPVNANGKPNYTLIQEIYDAV